MRWAGSRGRLHRSPEGGHGIPHAVACRSLGVGVLVLQVEGRRCQSRNDTKQGQRGDENEHAEQRDGQQAQRAQQPGGILMQRRPVPGPVRDDVSIITPVASQIPSRRTNAASTTTSGSRTTRPTKNTRIQACGSEE